MIKTKFLTIFIILLLTFNSNAAFELKVIVVKINIIIVFSLIIFYNFNVIEF